MGSEEEKLKSELKEKVFQILKDFLTRIAKLEELGNAGSRLLAGFQQALEFLRRPALDRSSEMIENIVKVNETKRVKSYFDAGCINIQERIQNMCKSKSALKELECLMEDVSGVIQTANKCLLPLWEEDYNNRLDLLAIDDKEVILSSDSDLREPELTEIAAFIGIIYSMVKQDYVMQERIVTSLTLKSLSGELESYCLMWSLHPFINDEIMHQAWRLIP